MSFINDLFWQNNANNMVQMCCPLQHQFRRQAKCEKMFVQGEFVKIFPTFGDV